MNSQIFGTKGKFVHFAHGNGLPPATYTELLDNLGHNYHVVAMDQRPLWQRYEQKSRCCTWTKMAQDQIDFLQHQALGPVVAIGHSMGANISLMAACLKPELYRALVLIDPAALSSFYTHALYWTPTFLKHRIKLVKRTLKRPDRWPSITDCYAFHRSKKVFSGITDQALWHYIEAATEADIDGVKLRYSKLWEAHIYCSPPSIWPYVNTCSCPQLMIRGQYSNTLSVMAWQRWQWQRPEQHYVQVDDVGHLLPMEKPVEVAQLAHQFMVRLP